MIMEESIAICMVTYNQEDYIAEAIESVLMQQLSIPFMLFIGEDCSTDRTKEICVKYYNMYPDKVTLIDNKQNLGLVKNTLSLLNIIQQKGYSYIAMLDGDDYWIDRGKLQKQYDRFLKNEDCGLIHTNIELLVNNKIQRKVQEKPLIGDVFQIIHHYNIANCSVMFRTSLLEYIDFTDLAENGFMSLDYVMYVIFSKYTKFCFLEDFTAVWRRGHASVSNNRNISKDIEYLDNGVNMWAYLGSVFPERFAFNPDAAERWRKSETFKIAFRYKNFRLANQIVKEEKLFENSSLTFRFKTICAKNIVLFNLWCFMKKSVNLYSLRRYRHNPNPPQ